MSFDFDGIERELDEAEAEQRAGLLTPVKRDALSARIKRSLAAGVAAVPDPLFRALWALFDEYETVMLALRREVAELRAAQRSGSALAYRGVYQAGASYAGGEFATWDGSLWRCARDTDAKPGTDDSWTLVVKRGRDGRDRRK